MAINIDSRPRVQVYLNNDSPPQPVYSYWNAAWNPILYGFNIINSNDVSSTLQILIYEFGSNTLLASVLTRPLKVGVFYVDLSSYLKAYLYNEYLPDFSAEINSRDLGADIRFYIRYQQTYDDGSQEQMFSDAQYIITASQAANQYGNQNGSNLKGYVPFAYDLDESLKAKFLTMFERPTKFSGYDLSLSFIFDNSLLGYGINRIQTSKDVNETDLSQETDALDISKVRHVNYLKIDHPAESIAEFVEVSLNIGDVSLDYYVDPGYVDEGYVEIL